MKRLHSVWLIWDIMSCYQNFEGLPVSVVPLVIWSCVLYVDPKLVETKTSWANRKAQTVTVTIMVTNIIICKS